MCPVERMKFVEKKVYNYLEKKYNVLYRRCNMCCIEGI
jgi:hypothetical protein